MAERRARGEKPDEREFYNFCLGPTHEEVITDIVRKNVRSYKQLPMNLFQIQTKFRDEIRPRFGLMRGREFTMKDGYSFHVDDADADREYWAMFNAYKRIFCRLGVKFRPVEADSGAIGGSFTHEFHVLAGSGEDAILSCDACDYTSNIEKTEAPALPVEDHGQAFELKKDHFRTPGVVGQVEQAAGMMDADHRRHAHHPDQQVLPLPRHLRGRDHEAGGRGAAGRPRGEPGEGEELRGRRGDGADAPGGGRGLHRRQAGFMGPVGLKDVPDPRGPQPRGRGEPHLRRQPHGLPPLRPGPGPRPAGLHLTRTSAWPPRATPAPAAGRGTYQAFRGIEVGQVFKLGTKYSKSMGCTFLDEQGKEKPMVMGCYGIGITRTVAAAIEQNYDADGIIWPWPIAPYQVHLV